MVNVSLYSHLIDSTTKQVEMKILNSKKKKRKKSQDILHIYLHTINCGIVGSVGEFGEKGVGNEIVDVALDAFPMIWL